MLDILIVKEPKGLKYNDEVNQLESAYTPRIDVNVRNSDPKAIAQMAATVETKLLYL